MKNFTKTGFGFDAHEYSQAGTLALGGIKIKKMPALKGHSDGDALIHAVIDSLLGAAGLGDIGELFPDTSKKTKGISSLSMLRDVVKKLSNKGFSLYHLDITVVADAPRLTPLKSKMKVVLAKWLKVKSTAVNIKAKTSEGTQILSPVGGVAAWAVATIIPTQP